MKILLYSFHLNGNTRPKINKTKKIENAKYDKGKARACKTTHSLLFQKFNHDVRGHFLAVQLVQFIESL